MPMCKGGTWAQYFGPTADMRSVLLRRGLLSWPLGGTTYMFPDVICCCSRSLKVSALGAWTIAWGRMLQTLVILGLKLYLCRSKRWWGGRIKYCDSLWCVRSVVWSSVVCHMQHGHWQYCKTRSHMKRSAAPEAISTGDFARALLHLAVFCTALSQTVQLYAALLLAVCCD